MQVSLEEVKIQAAIISAITTLTVLIVGWIIKFFYEKHSLNYKLKKEYEFEQKKLIKEEIAKVKNPILNAAEEFNYRMFNFNDNISKGYHRVKKEDWLCSKQYYLSSFIYRFLVLIHYCIKAEEDILLLDSTIAGDEDVHFLKYVKTFKSIFCEIKLLKELKYNPEEETHHFFRNELKGFTQWVVKDGKVLEFSEFRESLALADYDKYSKLIEYFTSIKFSKDDKARNVLRAMHMLTISFLNSFGHSFQQTEKRKLERLNLLYEKEFKLKVGFFSFLEDCKLEQDILKYFKQGLGKSPAWHSYFIFV